MATRRTIGVGWTVAFSCMMIGKMIAHAEAPTGPTTRCDVLLLGAGLANGLIALELRRRRPELSIVMLERRPGPDRLHTWCLFRSDVPAAAWSALEPLFEARWSGYEVAFPGHRRRLSTTYACLTGPALSGAVAAALGDGLIQPAEVLEADGTGARLADGRAFSAPLVIDGRGAEGGGALRFAWQKFAGLELRLDRPHGIELPVVMDAVVPQEDGYRFLYLLPLGPDRLLVEDTRYSDGPALDVAALEQEVVRYAGGRGLTVASVLRREAGVLPITLGGDFAAFQDGHPASLPAVGLRGGFFHPTTGYSLPRAVAVAGLIAATHPLESGVVAQRLRQQAAAAWRHDGFYRMLNRMLFRGAEPAARRRVLDRFYRLPQPLIERFYARRLTLWDKFRILTGKPPMPIFRAVGVLRDRPMPARTHA
jgi:lycopene beta-cyclase